MPERTWPHGSSLSIRSMKRPCFYAKFGFRLVEGDVEGRMYLRIDEALAPSADDHDWQLARADDRGVAGRCRR